MEESLTGITPTQTRGRVKITVALVLLTGWVAATIYGFWWFQVKDLRSFPLDTRNLQAQSGELAAGLKQLLLQSGTAPQKQQQITFINIWDPQCPCNRFSEAHIRDLVGSYRGKDVRTITMLANDTSGDAASLQQLAKLLYDTPMITTTDSPQLFDNKLLRYTPFAVVLNGEGDIQYVGPYSSGPACGRKGGAFVEKTLDALLAGKPTKGLQQNISGCFCDSRPQITVNS